MLARYLLSWFALAAIAILNGTLRVTTYGKVVPELPAHQISTITGIFFTGIAVRVLSRRWPLESSRQAWTIGLAWLLLTIVFEFGFGHFIAGHTWAQLINDYNIAAGRVWSLFLVWILVMPFVFFSLGRRAA